MRLAALAFLVLAGCGPFYFEKQDAQVITLKGGELQAHGVAFVTPSTVTGQEQEKQAVAMTFADVLRRERPNTRVATLGETLGAVNRAGLSDAYKRMYDDYRDTGLLAGDTLRRIGAATGTRYIAQINLQGLAQNSKSRFGVLGFRIVETEIGDARVFLQLWDSSTGSIVWEGMHEVRITYETLTDRPVATREVVEQAARSIVARLP